MRDRKKRKMWKEKLKRVVLFLWAGWCLCLSEHVFGAELLSEPISGVEEQKAMQEIDAEGAIYYTALGDSIANGYYGENEAEVVGYPKLLAADLEQISGKHVELSSFAKNGLTSKKLNEKILQDSFVIEQITKADLITLTIGANDLLQEFKKVSREILNTETKFYTADEAVSALQEGITENPLLLVNVVSAISAWDYDSFAQRWDATMECICAHKKTDAQMVVTTIYNPMAGRELPGTLNAVIESVISKMNEIIHKNARVYGYRVVELLGSGIEDYIQSDGLHPNRTGQNLIRELMEYQLDFDVFYEESTEKEAQKALEETVKKAEAAERKRQEERKEMYRLTVRRVVICLLVIAGFFFFWKNRNNEEQERRKKAKNKNRKA